MRRLLDLLLPTLIVVGFTLFLVNKYNVKQETFRCEFFTIKVDDSSFKEFEQIYLLDNENKELKTLIKDSMKKYHKCELDMNNVSSSKEITLMFPTY